MPFWPSLFLCSLWFTRPVVYFYFYFTSSVLLYYHTIILSDDFVQPCSWDYRMWEHWDDVANEETSVGGDAPPNERRAAAEANRFRKPWGCSTQRTGWEGERVDRLRPEMWVETVTEGGRRFMAAWRKEEVDAARHRQEKREATRLGNLLSQKEV